jgi:hypothetical protein
MSEAMSEYAGTPEEIRVTVAHADLALARGEVEAALRILEAIKPEQALVFLLFTMPPTLFPAKINILQFIKRVLFGKVPGEQCKKVIF